ncbi:MAG: TetR-like C-terminal domain-containing protein [Candidatus Pseudoruminococcus sp.]|nr:TetR-like C-terminal domain-containing protein [Candidatus Pseudoruminococcus sp.]
MQLFQYIEENHAVCYCALKSLGREHIKRFFASDIYDIIHHTIEQIGMDIGILDKKITKADIDLLTHFYVVSLVGIMESWLLGEIERTPQELVSFADQLLQDHVRGAKMRLQENTATI